MKNALAIVTLTLLATACTGLTPGMPAQPASTETTTEKAGAAQKAERAAEATTGKQLQSIDQEQSDAATATDALPPVELTDELLFKLLSAEIAYQRGDWQAAYITLIAVAHQTRDPRIARRAVEVALGAKQQEQTLTAIRLWHELAPASEEATQYFLGVIMLSDNLTEAQPIFEQRLQDIPAPARPLLMFQIQKLLARTKNKAAGFAMLERVLLPYQATPETPLVLAEGALANGDLKRAQAEARTALQARPDSELAALTSAQVADNKDDAEKVLLAFLAQHPLAHDVRIAYARQLIDQKQYLKAQVQFASVLQARPQDLTSLYALGILGTQNGDLRSAEKYLTAYLNALATQPDAKRDPNQALLILAQIAEERDDTDAALKWLAQIETGDAYIPAKIKQAQLIAKRGDVAAARQLLVNANADTESDEVRLLSAESFILREAHLMPEASATLEAGLKRFPDNTDLLYDYAMLAEKNAQLDLMESTLRKVMLLSPASQHAYNALGYSLAERNIRLPEAFILIEKALKLAPEDPFIMDSMGWVQFRLGKITEAEALLRRAYALRSDAEIAVHLGEVLWVKGAKNEAQNLWRAAQKKDPANDALKSTLARLQVTL